MSLKSQARKNLQSNRNLVSALAGKGVITVLGSNIGYNASSKVSSKKLGIKPALDNLKLS